MLAKKDYDKGALSIDDQIKLLKERGLTIDDEDEAKHYLSNISYYHLSGYFKPFQNEDDTFNEDVKFDDALRLYFFDRKLRLLFLNALERIEKSFKTQFVYCLSMKGGPHYLTDSVLFEKHRGNIMDNLVKSKEPFIKQFQEKYSDEYPPLWILSEILSFGDILYIFFSLEREDKESISKFYSMRWVYLHSWLNHLREIRNICAHYSRLWNRKITKHLKKGDHYLELQFDSRIFDSIVITAILLKKVSPKFDWLDRVEDLIGEYDVDCGKMGFPGDWKKDFENLK